MMIESKSEKPSDLPERNTPPLESSPPRQEDCLIQIVRPPVPGQTGWSIVPW